MTIDINKIIAMLPQRYPFILIDRVIDYVPGEQITAIKNVSAGDPWMAGHFPENPVMPGVLILEAMCQAGGVLVNLSRDEKNNQSARYLAGLDNVRFRKRVIPGDQLVIHGQILKKKLNIIKMEVTATVEGVLVAEAQIMASIGVENDTSDGDR
jgi:3-hydroxyacyl-[acyl-carrier-protein] dehydratase